MPLIVEFKQGGPIVEKVKHAVAAVAAAAAAGKEDTKNELPHQ